MQPLHERITERKLIQRGDLASCYQARDVRLDRRIFLKVLNPALTLDTEIRARFEREAKAAARIDHPNLVRIHEFGEDPDEGLYMIQEWVSGKTLRSLIEGRSTFSAQELIDIARQILSALEALHRAGILHRDVKPENILIDDNGRVRITDFSLAALQGAAQLTHHHAIVGTPAYMSPEQAAGRKPAVASDLFAVGIVLFELSTGRNPFAAPDMLEALRRVREHEPEFSESGFRGIPDALAGLIKACLRKDPARRPASAKEALKMIEDLPGEEINDSFTRRKIRPAIYIGAAAVLLLVILFSMNGFHEDSGPAVTEMRSHVPPAVVAHQDSAETAIDDAAAVSDERDSMTTTATEQAGEPPVDPAEAPGLKPSPRPEADREPLQPHDLEQTPPDSLDILLTTEPWAHVYTNGHRLGTTPLNNPLRLPVGTTHLSFQNSSYPVISPELEISDTTRRIHINLAEYVVTLELRIQPWAEVYIDDEHIGTSPLSAPLYLLPGPHKLRFMHPSLKPLTRSISAAASDSLRIVVDLNKSELAVLTAAGVKKP